MRVLPQVPLNEMDDDIVIIKRFIWKIELISAISSVIYINFEAKNAKN